MFWVVQEDLYQEYNYDKFINALDRLGVDYVMVKPIPFTDEFVDEDKIEIDDSQPIVISGAMSLSRVARKRGWIPGAFTFEDYKFEQWRDGFGKNNCMNGNAVVSKLIDAEFKGHDMFVRPVADNKAFTGTLMIREEFMGWQEHYSNIEPTDEYQLLHRDTEIMMCRPQNIMSEYRFFVIDGKVITGSLYQRGGKTIYEECIDEDVIGYVQKMIDIYQPSVAFVIDVARVYGEMKIIEVNSIVSSGYYACDVMKIIQAIEDLTPRFGGLEV